MSEMQMIEAVKTGHANRVQALIESGCDLEQKDNNGWTALNWAAGRGDFAALLQQAGREQGIEQQSSVGPYCKAYPACTFEQFPGWRTELAPDAIVYLHRDFSVTASMRHGETVVFDRISDLELSAEHRQRKQ
ncbi:MAG: ankyrin repeat domain-containing protein [Methylobacter sp.]